MREREKFDWAKALSWVGAALLVLAFWVLVVLVALEIAAATIS